MSRTFQITAVVGSPNLMSKTRVLIDAVVQQLQTLDRFEVSYVEVARLAPLIGAVTSPQDLPQEARDALQRIESADLVIAGSPVYKGSYTGLFKHLIDFLHPEALVNKPVLLVATGGSDRHALAVDQQLRPLFSFFRALTIPSAVYGSDLDFEQYQISSDALQTRVHEAARQTVRLLA